MNVYISSLAAALAADGIDVEIFTRAAEAEVPDTEEISPGVLLRHVGAGPRSTVSKEELPAHVTSLAGAMNRIRALLADGHFDVLHSHYWVSGLAGLLMTDSWEIPLVHSMHTMAKVKNRYRGPQDRVEPQARIAGEARIVRQAARLIANTTVEAQELETLYDADRRRIDVVAPGVDLDTFTPAGRGPARADIGVEPDAFHILFAGRIQRLKGPHVLLEALAELNRRRPDIPWRASILGAASGTDGLRLRPLVDRLGLARRVTLHEPVEPARLAQWYRTADIVAVPSYSESFGLVALEAQACGTPILATNVGGLSRAVRDGSTGLLVQGHRPAVWADALEKMYDDDSARRSMGEAAAVHARNFGWTRTSELTLASYERAAAERRRTVHG